MTDIRTVITDEGADWELVGDDLTLDRGPTTTGLITLFTWGRADAAEVLPDPRDIDRRGYWGDVEGSRWGSLLWILGRSILNNSTAAQARQIAIEAFQWWLDEEIAQSVDVEAEKAPNSATGVMVIAVQVNRGTAVGWPSLWQDIRDGTFRARQAGVELQLITAS